MKRREQGVALITAMLIVAFVATLAASLAIGQQVWLRQTQNLIDISQAESLRRGSLEFAAAILERDAKNNQTNTVDHLGEDWARQIPPLPVEGGVVLISIADAQGRFNLNSLLQIPPLPGTSAPPPPAGTTPAGLYRKLLQLVGLDPNLESALSDWVQPKDTGDIDYLNHDPPYRAAHQMLRSVDELRLVRGYTEEVVEKLRPYVVALPNTSPAINVNTAPDLVLAAMLNVDAETAKQLAAMRPERVFKTQNDITAISATFNPGQFVPGTLAFKSSYFIVSVATRIGRTQRQTEALLDRSGGTAVVPSWYREIVPKLVLDEDKS